MMSDVADPSTTSNLPKIEEVKGWGAEQLNSFLKERLNNTDNHINLLKAQEVDGEAFLEVTREELTALGIPLGPTKKLVKLINEIKGGKQTSFSPTPCHIRQ
jgi:hypothetical protein